MKSEAVQVVIGLQAEHISNEIKEMKHDAQRR